MLRLPCFDVVFVFEVLLLLLVLCVLFIIFGDMHSVVVAVFYVVIILHLFV